jgi:hypothetical protein
MGTSSTATSRSPASTVRSNASAAQATSSGGGGDCPFCKRTGFPILPLRYAVLPTFLHARPADILAGDSTLEQFADKPLAGHKYTLRTLRKGFVYVWLNKPGQWQVYVVSQAGYLRKLADPDDPDFKTERDLSAQCLREGHGVPASFVHIPPGYPTAWMAFSETVWGVEARQAAEKYPARRMQLLDINALSSSPDAQKHAFEVVAGGAKLRALVDEYAADVAEYQARTRYEAIEPSSNTKKSFTWTGAFGATGRPGQLESLGRYAADYSAEILRKHGKVRKVAAFALKDPVGILKELNHTRLHFVESKQNYATSVMRPLIVAQSIDGLEKIIRESALKRRTDEEALSKSPDVQTVYIPSGGYGPPTSFRTTRMQRATSDANAIWRKLDARLKPGAKKAFQDRYKTTIADFDRWIGHGDTSWAVWAEEGSWLHWFSDYNTKTVEGRALLLKNHAACLAGGIADVKSAAVWKKWLLASPFDDKNPIYRTLFGDAKTITEFLTPNAEGQLNKTDKLYDSVKALVQSDQGVRWLGEAAPVWLKSAAGEVGLAISGSAAALGSEISKVAQDTALVAQSAALKLYANIDATFMRVQLTVGEYQRLMAEVAFERSNALERSVTGLVKEGKQVVKSVVLGGMLSIDNIKVRDTLIEVVIWSFDKVSDIKRQLDAAMRNVGEVAQAGTALAAGVARTAGSSLGQEGSALMRQLRVAGLTLDREAGRILTAAQGQLRLSAAATRAFAKDMMTRTLRMAGGSGDILLAGGALAFQAWAARDGAKEVKDKLGALSSEAQLGVLSAGVGITGASLELLGAVAKQIGSQP